MKNETYIRTFATYEEAFDWMVSKNRPLKVAGNFDNCFAVVPGPGEGDLAYAVVDIDTAIDLGSGYVISSSGVSWTANPWAEK